MPFAASSIPGFTAALIAGLEARSNLSGVIVSDGPPPPIDERTQDVIYVGDVDGAQIVRALNRTTQPRREKMTIDVLISTVMAGRDQQTAVNVRAFAVLDELNQLLRGDTSLAAYYTGPGSIYGAVITHVKQTKRVNQENTYRECELDVGVYWEANI
jgi:hypothetical protein